MKDGKSVTVSLDFQGNVTRAIVAPTAPSIQNDPKPGRRRN